MVPAALVITLMLTHCGYQVWRGYERLDAECITLCRYQAREFRTLGPYPEQGGHRRKNSDIASAFEHSNA